MSLRRETLPRGWYEALTEEQVRAACGLAPETEIERECRDLAARHLAGTPIAKSYDGLFQRTLGKTTKQILRMLDELADAIEPAADIWARSDSKEPIAETFLAARNIARTAQVIAADLYELACEIEHLQNARMPPGWNETLARIMRDAAEGYRTTFSLIADEDLRALASYERAWLHHRRNVEQKRASQFWTGTAGGNGRLSAGGSPSEARRASSALSAWVRKSLAILRAGPSSIRSWMRVSGPPSSGKSDDS